MLRGLIVCLSLASAATSTTDWPQWRGPGGDNHAESSATAPRVWSETTGLRWSVALPGRGNSSPTVVGDRVYLTTGDEAAQTQSLLIHDRATGELLSAVEVHRGGLPEGVRGKNSHANATVASDGERLFVLFLNDGAPTLTAYDLGGGRLWRRRLGGPDPIPFVWGFGSSPVVAEGLVIVSAEHEEEGSGLRAFDTRTGEPAWSTPRPRSFSYSSPAVTTLEGQTVLLMCGNDRVAAYAASSGEELWSREAPTMATCGTMVWDRRLGLGFASGGHPKQFTLAIDPSNGHEIVWENSVKCYEQSLLAAGGFVYAVSDRGVAYCWRGADGAVMWKKRLGGNFSSSPLLLAGAVYATNEAGRTFVYEATAEGFREIARNQLGDSCYATPAAVGGVLYHRFGSGDGERLAAIGP